MESNQNLLNNELIVNQAAAAHLKESAGWARFLAFMSILMSVCIILGAVFFKQIWNQYENRYGSMGIKDEVLIGASVFYGILGLVLLFASIYHLSFGIKAKRAVATMDTLALAHAFKNLKGYYRIMGILTILGTLLMILGILGIFIENR